MTARSIVVVGTLLATGSVAMASSYFTLTNPATLGAQKLKPGQYEVSLKKDKAILTNPDGKTVAIPVRVEKADKKFSTTEVHVVPRNGSDELAEIDLGGSTDRLIFAQ